MIELDEQQDRVLRDLAATIGDAAEERALHRLRLVARLGLTVSRWRNREEFDAWDAERKAKNVVWWRR